MRLMVSTILVVAAAVLAAQDKPVTNHLAGSTSPYLLQHVHNPVDWYPWGTEAIERAKRENKPIFLSVGYSTCYWCHVMEREVFENEEIAKLMNDNFVCIKVDREERPDLDEIYMTATQLLTQHGGWPNSVFLTPELKPFFAGTYFGPEDQLGRPGFPTVIRQLREAWTNQRARVDDVAARVDEAIRSTLANGRAAAEADSPIELDDAIVKRCVAELERSVDRVDGGFGRAPKFPSDFYYAFLLDAVSPDADEQAKAVRDAVALTLDAMAAGGIHDHVGGGFHRYSVDGQWHVPHFEKMLYNQALLADAYCAAYNSKDGERYADVVRGIFKFVAQRFTGPEGQFYSALDAETDAVEGAYYAWNREEIVAALGEGDAKAFFGVYEIVPIPAMPGHLHPNGGALVRKDRRAQATTAERGWLDRLAKVRATRKLPRLDDKSIAAWNGMMIAAYAHAADIVPSTPGGKEWPNPLYIDAARRGASFVLTRMVTPDGALVRSVRGDSAGSHPAFLEDYAWVIRGLLALAEVDPDSSRAQEWGKRAVALAAKAESLFWDAEAGAYWVAEPAADLIARSKDFGDNATPSGNSVMVHNLLDLAAWTGEARYRERADEVLRVFAPALAAMPRGAVHMVHALHRRLWTGPDLAAAPLASSSKVKVSVPPTVSVEAGDASGAFEFTIKLAIDQGWHLNAAEDAARRLIPTTLEAKCADARVAIVGVESPPGTDMPSPVAGEPPLKILAGTVSFKVCGRITTPIAPSDSVQIALTLRLQACSDAGVCLKPSTVDARVLVDLAP